MAASATARLRELERRITKTARDRGTTAARLRRRVGFTVVCETLAEAVAQGIIPIFFVKGGVAIELRLGLLARATRDLDIGLCAPPAELLAFFDRALTRSRRRDDSAGYAEVDPAASGTHRRRVHRPVLTAYAETDKSTSSLRCSAAGTSTGMPSLRAASR